MTNAISPLVVRAELSNEEWVALRYLALQNKVRVSNLVGQAIRDYLAAQGAHIEGSVKNG
jgi:hypothetical protein